MDLAFAAGTLSTPAGVTREDSSRYAERHNVEDTKKAAVEAKTYLKRALEKSSELSKDNYKQLKKWLEKDENTLILTRDFLSKARNEMKRTLKLTLEKIGNPGSLGANPKRERSSTRAYPTLPTTKEEAEVAGTDRAEKWVSSNNINKSATQGRSNEEDANSKPPDYDQSVRLQGNTRRLSDAA